MPPPAAARPATLTLSVVVPAYNEARTIQEVLQRVLAVDLAPLGVKKEIIVVSDGSRDATAELARAVEGVTVLELPVNQGKGAAVRKGIAVSTGDFVLVQDADLEYEPSDYPTLLTPMLEGRADVVYGSRILGYEVAHPGGLGLRRHAGAYLWAYLGGRVVTWATNLILGTHLTDEPTCYKCFRGSLLRSIPLEGNRFEGEPEVTAKIARRGIEIHEVPIAYHPRTVSEGKKLRWQDGVIAVWTLLKHRVIP